MIRLGFDIETNSKYPDEVTAIWCIVTKDYDTNEVKEYHDYLNIAGRDGTIEDGVYSLLEADETISHNGICYDIYIVENLQYVTFSNKITDTFVLSTVGNPCRPGGHSVKAWGEKLGHHKVEHED